MMEFVNPSELPPKDFKMEVTDISDLEEGEILEYEICSPKGSFNGEPTLGSGRHFLKKSHRETSCEKTELNRMLLNQGNIIISSTYRREGYLNKSLKERLKLADKVIRRKKVSMYNNVKYKLEDNFSDSEYSSNEYEKTILNENRYLGTHNNGQHKKGRFKTKYHGQILHGTAEDIMSQIGKTIYRKSHCNFKGRKLRNLKVNLENDISFSGICHKEDSYSHVTNSKKRRHGKRKISRSDSESDDYRKCAKDDFCSRKHSGRRKKEIKDDYYSNDEIIGKGNRGTSLRKPSVKKLRDFDEVRKCLLEKLKKQKAEEEDDDEVIVIENSEPEVMPSGNQGNEIMNESIKHVNSLSNDEGTLEGGFNKENAVTETDNRRMSQQGNLDSEEDELDLKRLRLIALASNGKRKTERSLSSSTSKAENSLSGVDEYDIPNKGPAGGNSCERDDEDTDFDRNELLLRAEALKTALLKKHQKRLSKLKSNKLASVGSSSDNNSSGDNVKSLVTISPTPQNKENLIEDDVQEVESLVVFNSRVDVDAFKENLEKENGNKISTTCKDLSTIQTNQNEVASVLVTKSNRKRLKTVKKKIRKISALPSSIKEKDKGNDLAEEDDRILRSQLLCDLIKKKSLKESEKKSVLTDSVQTSISRSSPTVNSNNKSKSVLKSTPTVKSNVLRKINTSKSTKAEGLAKIPKPEIQRIIIHLGSDDSSEDESITATSSTSQTVLRESRNGGVTTSGNSNVPGERIDESIQASYERSVELLLSEARKKVEGEMLKANSMAPTPEAVYKHLPPSQRLEYIRLKQKIAEREKQKKLNGLSSCSVKNAARGRTEDVLGKPVVSEVGRITNAEVGSNQTNPNGSSVSEPGLNRSKGNTVQSSGLNSENRQNSHPVVKNNFSASKYARINKTVGSDRARKTFVLNKLKNKNETARSIEKSNCRILTRKYVAPSSLAESKSSNSQLASSNQILISKLKLLLKKIKIEKTIEENYDKEITKLKNQLSLVSKKRLEQRLKIKKLAEESMKIYRVIKNVTDPTGKGKPRAEETRERGKSEKTDCTNSVVKENEGKIEQGENEIDDCQRTEIENDSKDDISKDRSVGSGCGSGSVDRINEVASTETPSGTCDLSKYTSPLEVFAKAYMRRLLRDKLGMEDYSKEFNPLKEDGTDKVPSLSHRLGHGGVRSLSLHAGI